MVDCGQSLIVDPLIIVLPAAHVHIHHRRVDIQEWKTWNTFGCNGLKIKRLIDA